MALVECVVPSVDRPLPADVRRFIREADARIEEFQADSRIPAFVASTFPPAYHLLRSLTESGLTRGSQFCEWGCGFGVVASLAAMVGFDSCGIEIEGALVDEARRLAEDFELPVEFVRGSFIPRRGEGLVHAGGTYSWLSTDGDDAYEELGLGLDDMDVIFAYPWPDEEGITWELFERYGGVGAIMAVCQGGSEFIVRRKVRDRRGPRSR